MFKLFKRLFGKPEVSANRVDYSSDEENSYGGYHDHKENVQKMIAKFGSDSIHEKNMKQLLVVGPLTYLGSGAFSIVKKCYSRKYKDNIAVKIILTNDETNRSYINKFLPIELKLWAELSRESHENILNILEHFSVDQYLYIVTEFASCGDLMNCLHCGAMVESKAKSVFRGIISAIGFCHRKGIAHRDIKPDNLLLAKNDQIKLGDFSFVTDKNPVSCERCGTPGMLAPEQRDCGYYNPFISDIWQVGLTLYFMLFKEAPYSSTRKKHLLVEISQMKNTYNGVPFPKNRMLSTNCKDVIVGMLEIYPEKRWTVQDIEKSVWLS